MTERGPERGLPSLGELDTFRVAVGLAVVAGGLALVAPYLDALVAALAALATAGWAAGRARTRESGGPAIDGARGAALACVAVGAVAFLTLRGPVGAARGLLLALSWLPLWWLERRAAAPVRPAIRGAA